MIEYFVQTVKYLMDGASVSLMIFFVTLAGAFPLAVLLSLLRKFNKVLNKIISFYTWLFRGTPLMLQLFFFMFGLPALGIPVNRLTVAFLAFTINYSAYFTEIIRSGIESLPKDQEESAEVMGASKFKIYRYIVLPQAIRKEIPVITNEVITLIKDTALVTVIALSDLMRNVKEIVSRDFTISPFVVAAIFYLLISYLIIIFFRIIERKFDYI